MFAFTGAAVCAADAGDADDELGALLGGSTGEDDVPDELSGNVNMPDNVVDYGPSISIVIVVISAVGAVMFFINRKSFVESLV